MDMWANAGLIVGAYLLGALPLVHGIGRLYGIDLTKEEDAHISLWHKVGPAQGAAGIVSDMAKAVVPVAVGKATGFDIEVVALAGLMAVVGQMWPVFLRFNGGKGNTTGLAMVASLVALFPLLIALATMAIGLLMRTLPRLLQPGQSWKERLRFGGPPSLSLPLGMAVGFAVLPLSNWAFRQPLGVTLVCLALFLLIMVRRLTADLWRDLRVAESNKTSVIINRLLFDRSFR
ncbi:MAG: glycerol-3-phosphate acyltransferase [Chloroflexi bacterium]|nr:glycerol-3-phosphate acyltransferase [Chloroflexota bacterium]